MKIEVVEGTTGLLLVHVLGRERLACEAAYNRFLIGHKLKEWNLIVRTNLLDRSLVAQSITPDGQVSSEIIMAAPSDIQARLTELLEVELDRWLDHASAQATSD